MTEIISTLIKQHRALQAEVGEILACYQLAKPEAAEKINAGLKKFTQELVGHLKLENEVFYVQLLAKMKQAGQDTSKTELFIAEMKDIEKVVYTFLGKFKDTASIETNFENFQKEFDAIKQALVMRIESEEEGVYGYWDLY
jgi:regulator of sigma D